MANISTLTVSLVTETARFTAGLKKSRREANTFAADVKKTLTGIFALGSTVFVIRGLAEAGIQMERLQRGLRAATGSGEAAARELAFLRGESERLGLDLVTAGTSFTKLAAAAKGTALEGKAARDIFTSIAEASVVMGLSAEQTGGALTAIEQIISKGKVSAEELRGQLGERLPGAFQIAARAIGVTTSELDEMLKKGALTAEDLLPALAKELRNTFGSEVESAANSTQAALNRMSTAIFELKASIASSGVLDALALFANAIAFVLDPKSGFGEAADAIGKDIEALTLRAAQLSAQIKGIQEGGRQGETGGLLGRLASQLRGDVSVDELLAELDQVTAKLDKLKQRQLDILTGAGPVSRGSPNRAILLFEGASAELDKIFEKQNEDTKKAFDTFVRSFETAEQEVQRKLAELDLFKDLLPPEEFERIRAEIIATLTEGLEEIDINGLKKMRVSIKRTTDEMTEFAREAARNIQDAFADFFFDPFEGGLRGMLRSFVDVIRRMVANLLASKLLQYLATLPGPFGKFFKLGTGTGTSTGPGAAIGGFRRDQPFIAGERGPELVSPGVGSTVTPIQSPSFNFVTNINGAGGLEPAILIPILEQNNRKLKAEFVDQLRRGAFA